MLCTGWYIETFIWVVVTCVGFSIPFGNDRLALLSLLLLSFQVTSDFAMYIHVAVHFRSGFSGGEIHDLRRLRREGSPERLSRS